ncbi:phosphoesterase, partial [Archaeoglobales archaeon ex4484_92]
MNSDSDLNLLKESARKAASLVGRYDFVRVLTHYDADGISAGAIVASALLRANKGFQLTFLKGLNESFEYERDELLIFLDMGSGYPDVISSVEADVIVLDHHLPTGKINAKKEFVHVNPHLYGFDGTYELSASGVAYFFANELGNNKWGVIEEKPGVCLHSGKLRDVLSRSIEPYLDLYKKDDELESFLKKAKLDGEKEFDDLSIDEMHRLANAVTLRLLKMGAYEGVIEQIIGRRFILKNLPIVNAHMLT